MSKKVPATDDEVKFKEDSSSGKKLVDFMNGTEAVLCDHFGQDQKKYIKSLITLTGHFNIRHW